MTTNNKHKKQWQQTMTINNDNKHKKQWQQNQQQQLVVLYCSCSVLPLDCILQPCREGEIKSEGGLGTSVWIPHPGWRCIVFIVIACLCHTQGWWHTYIHSVVLHASLCHAQGWNSEYSRCGIACNVTWARPSHDKGGQKHRVTQS